MNESNTICLATSPQFGLCPFQWFLFWFWYRNDLDYFFPFVVLLWNIFVKIVLPRQVESSLRFLPHIAKLLSRTTGSHYSTSHNTQVCLFPYWQWIDFYHYSNLKDALW